MPGPNINFGPVGPWNTDGLIIVPDELTQDQSQYVRDLLAVGFPLIFTTHEGQAHMLADVIDIVRALPNGRGLGVMWWDATWTSVPGNGWDPFDPSSGNNWANQALFDFKDRALPAMNLFNQW